MKTVEKKVLLGLFSLFIILAFASFAKATITISQPLDIYNLGDTLNVDVKASYGQDISGFLRVVLVCDNEEALRYFSPIKLEANKEKSTEIEWSISKIFESCYISASLEDEKSTFEETESSEFELTGRIEINASLNKNSFEPSEELKINGKAIKANSQAFDGAVIIAFDEKEYPISASKGSFSFSMPLASDISAGAHTIAINAKDNYGNSGSVELSFDVAAIPTSLIIETSNESFLPGELLVIKPKLLDQAENIIAKNILIKFSIPKTGLLNEETILLEELVRSGNSTFYRFAKDAEPKSYLIEAETSGFETEKNIEVQILEKLNFSIENETLNVTNIGNVPYNKPIEIKFKIDNQTTVQIIDIELEVGETKVFTLSAPKGNYEIEIMTHNETASFPNVPLTGGVVTVIELKSKSAVNKKLRVFLTILIALVILVLVLYFTKKHKYKYPYHKTKTNSKHKHEKISVEAEAGAVSKTDPDIKTAFKKHSKDLAAHTLAPALVYGTKQELTTAVVSLSGIGKSKNKNEALDNFFSAVINKIKAKQGVADLHGNSLIIMFNIIKQYRHDVAAIRTAQEIRNISTKLNIKTKTGINTGMAMIGSIKPDKSIKYTQIANSIAIAKALAEKARDNEILLSGNVKRRTSSVIKTRKILPYYISNKEAIEVYALEDASPKEIRDRHKWFVDRALGK